MNRANREHVRHVAGRFYFNGYVGLFAICTALLLWKHLWGWAVFTAIAMGFAWALARALEEYGKASLANAARVVIRSIRRER